MSSGVEFEEDSFGNKSKPQFGRPMSPVGGFSASSGPVSNYSGPTPNLPSSYNHESKMIQFLMRHGLAKSSNSAQGIMIGVVIINIIITFILIRYFI